MFRFIIGLFLIILLASVLGIDGCDCGMGPSVRSNLQKIFSGFYTDKNYQKKEVELIKEK